MSHPLTRDVDIDGPSHVEARHRIIRAKPFLRRIYQEWYAQIAAPFASGSEGILEIGTGGGFLREYLPHAMTSDVSHHSSVDLILDALCLPFGDGSLRGIVMVDVLHHLSEPRRFFAEAARCVRPGGTLVMIEPWLTAWSRLVYRKLHHEPCRPDAAEWEFPSTGPLSGANAALPWMIFERDRSQFAREFPSWRIQTIEVQMPFRYLLSGGVSMRGLAPAWSFGLWRCLERALHPWMRSLGMFALITLERSRVSD